MKKRFLSVVLALLITTSVVGCGEKSDVNKGEQIENGAEQDNATTDTEKQESSDLTFSDLATRQFGFSSGVGGWAEEFAIEADGSFTGNFHDVDMGVTGEGYENGTFYCCSYAGHFTDLTKINDYTYQMKLADITYEEDPDTEEIIDNTLYKYTASYCLGETDTFTIYLPRTPLSELSEEVLMWISGMNQSETELTMIAIADETNGYGIYSTDRYY